MLWPQALRSKVFCIRMLVDEVLSWPLVWEGWIVAKACLNQLYHWSSDTEYTIERVRTPTKPDCRHFVRVRKKVMIGTPLARVVDRRLFYQSTRSNNITLGGSFYPSVSEQGVPSRHVRIIHTIYKRWLIDQSNSQESFARNEPLQRLDAAIVCNEGPGCGDSTTIGTTLRHRWWGGIWTLSQQKRGVFQGTNQSMCL